MQGNLLQEAQYVLSSGGTEENGANYRHTTPKSTTD